MNIVFGGTGFLGEALIPRLKGDILVIARDEGKLISLKTKFPKIKIMSGDIADEWTVKKAMKDAENVFVLSAYKHVRSAEDEAFQCTKTNAIGMMNVLYESLKTKPKLVFFISTDKAAQISGVYGATKYIGEKLLQEAEKINPHTKYRCVRYGNIMYSTGSVMCLWKENMLRGKEVICTDPCMTRFYWTREEAVDLIFEAMKKAKDAKPYIPDMKAMSLGDLLKAMMKKYGEVPIKYVGAQEGENMHETIDGEVFSNQVEQFTIEEIREKI
jgi:UDP-N-acetylglucosamine 4,6-dehydratase